MMRGGRPPGAADLDGRQRLLGENRGLRRQNASQGERAGRGASKQTIAEHV